MAQMVFHPDSSESQRTGAALQTKSTCPIRAVRIPSRSSGFEVRAGELGDNITAAGLHLESLPLGTLMELGPRAMIELTASDAI